MGVELDTEGETGDQAVLDDLPQGDERQQIDSPPEPVVGDLAESEQQAEEAPGEVVVSIGDEPEPNPEGDEARHAPAWVKELRKNSREKDRRIRELENKLAAKTQQTPPQGGAGEKPTLEGCDFDADVFEAKLIAWDARKREADEAERKQQENARQTEQQWQATAQSYNAEKAKFRETYPDFDEAEGVVKDALSLTQQNLILHVIKSRAAMVAALGASPKKLQELASIKDPIMFTASIAVLEKDLKVTPRKPAPLPERQLRASAPGGLVPSARLEQLRAEAERTGNYDSYLAAKRAMKK